MKAVRALMCLMLWIASANASAQMPDPQPNATFSISRDDVMQFIESRIDAGTADALLAVHQACVEKHIAEAAAAQRRYEGFQASSKTKGRELHPEVTRDYGRLLCEWQQARRAVIVDFEQAGAHVLGDALAAAWTSQTASWRRQRVLLEIDWSQRMESMADLLAVLDKVKITLEEKQAIVEARARYETEMDSALRDWEQRIDLLWREFYENEYDNRGDADKRKARWLSLYEQQQALERAVQEVNRRIVPEFQSRLGGESAAAFATGVHARDLPQLFAPTVVDAVLAMLREHGRIDAERLALLEVLHQSYVSSRGSLRVQMIAAHRKWMEPRWVEARIKEREQAISEQRSPFDSMRGHPGLGVLRQLQELEFETLARFREMFTAEEIARLPEGVRMLLMLK